MAEATLKEQLNTAVKDAMRNKDKTRLVRFPGRVRPRRVERVVPAKVPAVGRVSCGRLFRKGP